MTPHIWLLAFGMLVCGAFNTISTKKQDLIVVGHTWDGRAITFYHPVVQSACMFLGEFLCLLPYAIVVWCKRGKKKALAASRAAQEPDLTEPFLADSAVACPESTRMASADQTVKKIFAFAIPTLCDALTTTLMNVGLYYTSASVYQMLRGTLVFFAGILTMVILKRRLYLHHWQGMMLIMVGAGIVGVTSIVYSDCEDVDGDGATAAASQATAACTAGWGVSCGMQQLSRLGQRLAPLLLGTNSVPGAALGKGREQRQCSNSKAKNPLLGNSLVMLAQVFAATQFIIEEKYVSHFHMPALLAVGLEGFWGLILSCLALPLFHFIKGPDGYPLDDARRAFQEFVANPALSMWVVSSILSIATFNFFGISVTKKLSGASRATIDACRTILVWTYSLYVGWEQFYGLQVLGYVILVSGTTLYNELMAAFLTPVPEPSRSGEASDEVRAIHSIPRRGPPLPSSSPYDMARSLRISRAQLSPHSIGSMGGVMPDMSPTPPEVWGSPIARRPITPRGQPRRIGETANSFPAVSLYDVWYSGMDVSPERPLSRPHASRPGVGHPPVRKASPLQTNTFSASMAPQAQESTQEQQPQVPEFSFTAAPPAPRVTQPACGMLSTMRDQLAVSPQTQPSQPTQILSQSEPSEEASPCDSLLPGPSLENLDSNLSQEEDDVFGPVGRLSRSNSTADTASPAEPLRSVL